MLNQYERKTYCSKPFFVFIGNLEANLLSLTLHVGVQCVCMYVQCTCHCMTHEIVHKNKLAHGSKHHIHNAQNQKRFSPTMYIMDTIMLFTYLDAPYM